MNTIYVILTFVLVLIFEIYIWYYMKKKQTEYDTDISNLSSLIDKQTKSIQLLQSKTSSVTFQSSNSSTEIGSIVLFSGDTIPENYNLCDGSMFAISDYPDLFAVIKTTYNQPNIDTNINFNIPDLRDVFVRSTGQSHTLGSYQKWSTGMPQNQFQNQNSGNHTHVTSNAGSHSHETMWAGINANSSLNGASAIEKVRHWITCCNTDGSTTSISPTDVSGDHVHDVTASGDHTHILVGGDSETRPDNISLNYIIRIK